MPPSPLDPNTALIVVDLQRGIAALPTVHPMPPLVERAARLAAAFRECALPVVLVSVIGTAPGRSEHPRRSIDADAAWAELLPELDAQAGDHRVTKRTWGAFTGTDLAEYLRKRGVTQVVVCGVATSIGVESTARQAHEQGLHVTLAIDAMTDLDAAAHANSVQRIFPRLGERATTEELVQLLRARRAPAG